MGRIIKNAQGQDVYVPSASERAGVDLPAGIANPFSYRGLQELVSPISGMGVVPDIESQQPVIYDRDELRFENLLLNEEQNERMREYEREQRRRKEEHERQQKEEYERKLRESAEYADYQRRLEEWKSRLRAAVREGRTEEWMEREGDLKPEPPIQRRDQPFPEDTTGFMEIPTTQTAAGREAGRIQQETKLRQQQELEQKIDHRRQQKREKHLAEKQRRQNMLDSPLAKEWVEKIRRGQATVEQFKTEWTSNQDAENAAAWNIRVEGEAFDELYARSVRGSSMSYLAGNLSGRQSDGGKSISDPDTRGAILAELKAKHDQRELAKKERLESMHMPGHQPREYEPKPFDPLSRETEQLFRQRVQSKAASEVVRHKEVRPVGVQQVAGGLHGEQPSEATVFSDPEKEQQDAVERYFEVNSSLFQDEQASPEDITNLAQTARSVANELVLRTQGIADADERQRVFQQSLDSYFKSQNLPTLTPEIKNELFGRGVMAVIGAQNDVRDALNTLRKVDNAYIIESESIKDDVDTGNDKNQLAKVSRAFGVNLFENIDHGKAKERQRAALEERRKLMDKIASIAQNSELPADIRKQAKNEYLRLYNEHKQYDDSINYDNNVKSFASQTKMPEKEVRQKFSPEELGHHYRTLELNASAVQEAELDKIAGWIGKGALISYALAPFYGVDEASKKIGTLTLMPFSAAAHGAVRTLNGAIGIAAAFDPSLVSTAITMQDFLDLNAEAIGRLEKQKFGDWTGERLGGIREAGASFWQLMFAGTMGLGVKGISAAYGLSEFGDAHTRAKKMGLSDEMAFSHATLSGLAEAVPQLLFPGFNKYAAVMAKGGWQRGMAGATRRYRDFLFKKFLPVAGTELVQENLTTYYQLLSTGLFMTDDAEQYMEDNLGAALLKTTEVTLYMSFMAAGGQAAQQKRTPFADAAAFINATRKSVGEAYVNLDALADAVDASGYVDGVNLAQIHGLNPAAAKELQRRGASRNMVRLLLGRRIADKLTTREARDRFASLLINHATTAGETARQAIREEQGAPEPFTPVQVRDSQGNIHTVKVPGVVGEEDARMWVNDNVTDSQGNNVEIIQSAASDRQQAKEDAFETKPEEPPIVDEPVSETEAVAEPDPIVEPEVVPEVDESSELLDEIKSLQKDQDEEVKAWKKRKKREGGKETSVSGNTLQQKLRSALKLIGITAEQALDGNVLLSAYRQRAKDTHPDSGGTTEQFKAVQDAYDLLQAFPATIRRSALKARHKALKKGQKVSPVKTPAPVAPTEAPADALPEASAEAPAEAPAEAATVEESIAAEANVIQNETEGMGHRELYKYFEETLSNAWFDRYHDAVAKLKGKERSDKAKQLEATVREIDKEMHGETLYQHWSDAQQTDHSQRYWSARIAFIKQLESDAATAKETQRAALEAMSKGELRELAKKRGYENYSQKNKKGLINLLTKQKPPLGSKVEGSNLFRGEMVPEGADRPNIARPKSISDVTGMTPEKVVENKKAAIKGIISRIRQLKQQLKDAGGIHADFSVRQDLIDEIRGEENSLGFERRTLAEYEQKIIDQKETEKAAELLSDLIYLSTGDTAYSYAMQREEYSSDEASRELLLGPTPEGYSPSVISYDVKPHRQLDVTGMRTAEEILDFLDFSRKIKDAIWERIGNEEASPFRLLRGKAGRLFVDTLRKRGVQSVVYSEGSDTNITILDKSIATRGEAKPAAEFAPTEAATEQEVASVPADPSTFEVGPGAREDASRPVFKPRTMTPEQQKELYKFSKGEGVKPKDVLEKYDEIMGTTPDEKLARRQRAFVLYGESEGGKWALEGGTVGRMGEDGALNERHADAQGRPGLGRSNRRIPSTPKYGNAETRAIDLIDGDKPHNDPSFTLKDRGTKEQQDEYSRLRKTRGGIRDAKKYALGIILNELYPGAKIKAGVVGKHGPAEFGEMVGTPDRTKEELQAQKARQEEYRREQEEKRQKPAPKKKKPPPLKATPPPLQTPAEKQQQKVDAAKQELKDALADVVRNPKLLSGVPISDQEIRAAKAVFNYLYERAKQLGISAREAAKELYKDFNKKRGEDSWFDKVVSSKILEVDQRLKTDEKLEALNKEYEDLHETLETKRNAFYLKFPGATLAGQTLLSAFKMVQKTYLHYGDILEQTGEAGKRIAITMRNASDKIGRFLGELQPAVIDAHKKFRGTVPWKLQQVQQKGQRWGVARIVDLVEGRIEPENAAEKEAVDAIRKLNLKTGEILKRVKLLQKTQDGRTVKFEVTPEGKVYLRMATEEMRLLLLHRNVGGNAKLFKSVVKAFAEANNMNERQVEAVFVSMAEKYSDVTKLSTHSHIGPELQRAFDVVPTHVLDDNNHWVPLFESFPDQYVDSIASSTAHRAAFVQHFGQDGAIARKLREILNKANGDVVMFDQMLRRISGLPPKPKGEFIVQNNYYRKYWRLYHAETRLGAVGAMTGAAVVNIPEVLVTTIRKMGPKAYLESIVRGMIPRKTLSQKEIDLFKVLGVSDAEIANKQKHAKVYSRVAHGIIRDLLISSRAVTRDVLLWNVDRNNISASIINRFAGILNRVSLVHFMNEAQESRAGLAAVSRIGDIVQRAKRGETAREADVLMFLQIGMSDSMAQKLANGTADPDNYKSAIRRLVDFLTASTGTPAEKSPYSQTPIWKSNVFFMTYFQGQMRRIHKEVAFLHPRHPFKRRFRAGTEIAKLIGYGAIAGQIASLLLGMSFSGRVGWDEWEEEAKKAWEGSLWDKLSWIGDGLYFSLVGGIYATAANTMKSISTDGLLNSTPFNAAKSVMFPIGLGWDTLQYIDDSGQYRKKTFVDYLRNRVAGTKRAIPTQIIIGLGELIDKDGYITNPDIQAAFKHYWKWKREFDPKPFMDLGKADKETKEFHVALNRAANLYSKGKVEQADKIIEDIIYAGDPMYKDRKDRITRIRTYLSRQQKLRSLSDEERKSLKDNVSSTTYEILEAWDEAIEGLKPKTRTEYTPE